MDALIKRAQAGDKEAAEQLVAENTGLIWSVARRYFGRGTEADDLFQLGALGFLKAIAGFDASYGTQFSTYAVPKIAGEIRRFLRDDGAIKVSRSVKERAIAIKQTRERMTTELGREPTVTELAEELELSVEEIAGAETATAGTQSMQQEAGEDGFTLENVLTQTGEQERILEHLALKEALAKLPERERMIISLRYYHSLTQERVARIVGVSQVQISRIEKKALQKMKEML